MPGVYIREERRWDRVKLMPLGSAVPKAGQPSRPARWLCDRSSSLFCFSLRALLPEPSREHGPR
jgi:hypothetical protein